MVYKIKAYLRAQAERSLDALWRAIGDICDVVEPKLSGGGTLLGPSALRD
ncbi:hypothetical protein [Microvirga sp. VF16]|nr:hypothetical protein [Microvirga sp. VF16]QRM34287.1 hypothetical protein JO965_34210 [Microvirga sp. VF16]